MLYTYHDQKSCPVLSLAPRRKRKRRAAATWLSVLLVGLALLLLMLYAHRPDDRLRVWQPVLGGDSGSCRSRMAHTISDVPYLSQREQYETGCESVSAAMLLNDCGFDITVDEFIDAYLPLGDAPYTDETGRWLGCDPWEAFPGDPRTPDGWGCYSTVIEGAMNRCLAGSGRRAKRLSGVPLDELCAEYIDRDQPVLIWATIDMEPPVTGITWTVPETRREITWIYPMHCLVLIGYDADSYIFNDPWAGECAAYDKESVELAYTTLYEQAIVLP